MVAYTLTSFPVIPWTLTLYSLGGTQEALFCLWRSARVVSAKQLPLEKPRNYFFILYWGLKTFLNARACQMLFMGERVEPGLWSFWFWMFLLLVDHHLNERRLKSGLRDLVQMFRIKLGTAKKTISLYSDFSVARQTRLWLFSATLVPAFTSFSLNSSFILSFPASHRLNGSVT